MIGRCCRSNVWLTTFVFLMSIFVNIGAMDILTLCGKCTMYVCYNDIVHYRMIGRSCKSNVWLTTFVFFGSIFVIIGAMQHLTLCGEYTMYVCCDDIITRSIVLDYMYVYFYTWLKKILKKRKYTRQFVFCFVLFLVFVWQNSFKVA